MKRGWGVLLGVASVTALFAALAAASDDYPSKPIEVLVGFAAGGSTDVVSRVASEAVQRQWRTSVVVLNKPGASGSVAAKQVSHARPDGYTLLAISVQHSVFPAISEVPPYSVHDFEPIAKLAYSPMLVNVNAQSPWKTMNDVVDHARKNPGKLKVGTAGVGSVGNIIFEIIKRRAKIETVTMPFVSEIDAMTAVLGGHVDVGIISLGVASPNLKSGRVRALAATSHERFSLVPDVPTVGELGYGEAAHSAYIGILAPKNVPPERLLKLVKAYEKALGDPEVVEKLRKLGFVPDYQPPAHFQKFMVDQYDMFKRIAKEANISIK